MQLVVFEDAAYVNLLPLVYTRATFNLRCGFDNLLDKMETACGVTASALFVRPLLTAVFQERQRRPVNQMPLGDDHLWLNGRLLLRRRGELPPDAAVWRGDTLLAARLDRRTAAALSPETLLDPAALRAVLAHCRPAELKPEAAQLIDHPWQLVHENSAEIVRQFAAHGPQVRGVVYAGAHLVHDAAIHIGEGTRVKPGAVLDAEDGPIFLGDGVTVSPNAVLIGPCFIGDGCVIQPGARIRPGSAIHMRCKVGGEVEGTIFHGYSNKQHDGFLGHAYVGEWVNLGAGTTNSDLKNTYGPVRVPINGRPVDSGQRFVGSFIGDHVKTGIQTTLPTGAVLGFAASVFLSRVVPQFVPSFTWLTDAAGGGRGAGAEENDPDRAWAVAVQMASRRGRTLSAAEQALFFAVQEEAKRIEQAEE